MAVSITRSFVLSIVLLSTFNHVSAHGTITSVTGANGVQSAGFGIIADTPRNGGLPVPFEQDTSVIRDNEIASGKTGVCGSTKAGGNNDVSAQLAAASNAGLPTTSSAGDITMNLHQVNQDGAGPFTCDVSTDGGNTFQPAQVTQNVPGVNGLSLAVATDFPLTMQVATTNCTGGPAGNACIARCRNPALAGPFGSCVAFAMGSTGSNTTGDVTATTAADVSAAATTAAASSVTSAAAAPATTPAAKQTTGKLGGLVKNLLGRRGETALMKKRLINSRVAGANAGYWIDA
ncbi:hypothetical protein K439DRAFT_572967 [Ramaria rubella]|nr:hypothetical protein K439DRAFT_572967 [Ramaria rubella]